MTRNSLPGHLTTPDKPIDITQVFPQLSDLARVTVRLHPRPGDPAVGDSSMGGPLLWPADEPWPVCESFVPFDQEGSRSEDEREWHQPAPLLPVLQLYARDVPELPFPEETDLCQVLWCPTDHGDDYMPNVMVRWRDSATVSTVQTCPQPVIFEDSDEGYLPTACVLNPERVPEFPDYSDLPEDLQDHVISWENSAEAENWMYQYHLSVAPGTKVGGWVGWIQWPDWPTCPKGHSMEHLLTITSRESDGESWKTWTPVQDQADIGWHPSTVNGEPVRIALVPHQRPAGLMIGDAGSLYVFTCTICPERPIRFRGQCS